MEKEMKERVVPVTYLADHKVRQGEAVVRWCAPYLYVQHPKYGTFERHYWHQELPIWVSSFMFLSQLSWL